MIKSFASPQAPGSSRIEEPRVVFPIPTVVLKVAIMSMAPPLQYSCLENPMDGGAWNAAVHGVAEGQTRLKPLSSSSIMSSIDLFAEVIICFSKFSIMVMLQKIRTPTEF